MAGGKQERKRMVRWGVLLGLCASSIVLYPLLGQTNPTNPNIDQNALLRQPQQEADAKSTGCLSCHQGIEPMHASNAVKLGCTDCHGGDATAAAAAGVTSGAEYDAAKNKGHIHPRFPKRWARDGKPSTSNPVNSFTLLNEESPEFVKFVNPGDLRVAREACGGCHLKQVNAVPKSTMATAAVFWAAASYANGILGQKYAILGENYTRDGKPGLIKPVTPLTEEQIRKGAVPFLAPLPRWEITQPGEYFRAFERGGLIQPSTFPEIGNPNPGEDAGRPDIRLSSRGRGTGLRVSPAIVNITKTRLNDPHLSFLGTNDHPGDYRSSGCSGCHVAYANDRDFLNSGPYARFGNQGHSFSGDPTIPKNESGHPIQHRLSSAVPTSACMSCHMHQPNSFVNTYLGYTMWSYESDAEFMFPKKQAYPTEAEKHASLANNPEGAAVRGLWKNLDFLEKVSELNPKLQHTQFADYHGHGWVFEAVFKKDRKGNMLDANDNKVAFDDPDKFKKAVHLKDIHLEKGMHCADCHFSQDEHGDGLLHGEYGDTIEIECKDCHGDINNLATLRSSGPDAPAGGTDLAAGVTPYGRRRFAWRDGKLFQRSMLNEDMEWEVVQTKDSITPGNAHYNERSRYAKTMQRDGSTWGSVAPASQLAHPDSKMTCYSCHSSWITSCFGCHLPQEANAKTPRLHYEGGDTRNYASYNPQVVRSDVYMLCINGTNKGHKIAPARSSSALTLSSINASRQRIYIQQPTISAPGYNGQAFNAHVPHTVRARETKMCEDCHVSADNNNNAWMAQLLLQGTNFVNLIGRFAWVGEDKGGFEAVAVTEFDEPQAVIGSSLHKIVYPDYYAKHQSKGRELSVAHHHHGEISSLQLRGEYLFSAGEKGFEAYDVANVDNKDFSERLTSSPVSPIGQNTFVKTKDATAVALPTNNPIAPFRKSDPVNQEQPWHPIYHYAFVSDREEGLVLINVDTLTDADPENNFLKRSLTFNPDEALKGAESVTVAGNHVYVGCDRGLVVSDFSDPMNPKIVATIPELKKATSITVQFRYAFVVVPDSGLSVVDITNPESPVVVKTVPIEGARSVYVARTYAYVAAGKNGLVIVDVERPDDAKIDQTFTADGALDDVHDVKVGSTNQSLFAYVANGHKGLAVVQLTSPNTVPGYLGFSPRPVPQLIATRHTHGPAVALSKGLDRDRAADESGNQVIVFNRIGARPMNLEETQRMYLRDGKLYTVQNSPKTRPQDSTGTTQAAGKR